MIQNYKNLYDGAYSTDSTQKTGQIESLNSVNKRKQKRSPNKIVTVNRSNEFILQKKRPGSTMEVSDTTYTDQHYHHHNNY